MPVPRRDLEATRDALEAWLHRRLPRARGLAVSPLSGPAATGFSNDTLLFDLRYEEGGRGVERALVCRIEPTGFGIFPRYDVAQQFHVLRALGGTDVPVPEVLWLEPDAGALGAPFFVMERVAGRIPSDNPPYHAGGWLTEAPAAERAAIWWSALDALAAIHRQDPARLGLDFLDAPALDADPSAWQLEFWTRYYGWVCGGTPQPLVEAALEWLRERRPRGGRERRLCWGDSRIGNMIFRDGRCVAVLDWEMATLGPPEMDLGWFLYMDRHHGEGVGAARLAGFPGREETVARYEARLGRRVEHLDYWEAFAAFRFAVIMARVGAQLVHLGFLPPDSTFAIDNTASRLMAKLLELPPPAPAAPPSHPDGAPAPGPASRPSGTP
jgi:aminoglycoside phosphotransferase (APT) family kinase protein